jgi:hypothetical protein
MSVPIIQFNYKTAVILLLLVIVVLLIWIAFVLDDIYWLVTETNLNTEILFNRTVESDN